MIVSEIVNGMRHTYSDTGHEIVQHPTNDVYGDAWDDLDAGYTYEEAETMADVGEEPEEPEVIENELSGFAKPV